MLEDIFQVFERDLGGYIFIVKDEQEERSGRKGKAIILDFVS